MKTLSHRGMPPLSAMFLWVTMILPLCTWSQDQGVAINTSGNLPHPAAMLDVSSTNKGILIPRISMVSLPVIPAPGLLVYVTDVDPGFWYYDAGQWNKIMRTADQKWSGSPDIYYNGGKVGIGTTTPTSLLDVESADNTSTAVDVNNTSTAGDPQVRFQVSGSTKFCLGVDNSDADKFKIGTTTVSTNARMTLTSTGEMGIGTESPAATLHLNGTAKVLGPWETKTQGTDYLAATDGFVVAGLIVNSGSPDANAGLKGYTDNLAHPVACRGLACVRKIYPGTQNGQDSFTMPVRKGNYWRVDYDYLEGSVGYSIEWIPFGTANP